MVQIRRQLVASVLRAETGLEQLDGQRATSAGGRRQPGRQPIDTTDEGFSFLSSRRQTMLLLHRFLTLGQERQRAPVKHQLPCNVRGQDGYVFASVCLFVAGQEYYKKASIR